jgi:APA family basic amino acid/polyamine antiporter
LQRIGQDFALLSFLSKENEAGIPQSAILFQLALTIILIWTSSFEAILMFSGFALGLNTLMTVLGVWYLRRYHPSIERPFEVPWYPWPMIIFVGLMLWTLIYVVIERPLEGLLALALVIAGWCFYLVSQQWEIQK